jgi:hypothetical protein
VKLLALDGRACDARCHAAATDTACSCICGGRFHAVGSTDAARLTLIADHGLTGYLDTSSADDDEALADLLATELSSDAPGREAFDRWKTLLRGRSSKERIPLVLAVARRWWTAAASGVKS